MLRGQQMPPDSSQHVGSPSRLQTPPEYLPLRLSTAHPRPARSSAEANGSRPMRACRAGLAALWAVSLLCWAASGAQGRQIAEPEPAGAAALDTLVFGSAGGDEGDHAAQPRLFKQELPAEAREGAAEQKEGEGEDKTIAQVGWWGSQSVQHRAGSAVDRAMGLQLPASGGRRAPPAAPRCLFEWAPWPWPGPLPQMLDEKLKEEFKKEEEQKEGAGKQFNETVASSEVGVGPRSWKQPARSRWH